MDKNILIVNKDNEPIGESTQQEALEQGLYQCIARVILRDENGRILSQRRSATKKVSPNLWTDSASGHVDVGETFLVAAHRELFEEVGMQTELRYVGEFFTQHAYFGKVAPVFHTVYEGTVSSNSTFVLQQTEVSATVWHSLDELVVLVGNDRGQFTRGFVEILERYYFNV